MPESRSSGNSGYGRANRAADRADEAPKSLTRSSIDDGSRHPNSSGVLVQASDRFQWSGNPSGSFTNSQHQGSETAKTRSTTALSHQSPVRFMRAVRPERLQNPLWVIPFQSVPSVQFVFPTRCRSRGAFDRGGDATAGRNVRIRIERRERMRTDGVDFGRTLEWPHHLAPGLFSGISACQWLQRPLVRRWMMPKLRMKRHGAA